MYYARGMQTMRFSSSAVAALLLAVPLWLVVATPDVSAALSECQRCEQTGDCATAYQGTPGHFCGHWLDRASQRQSCCCPVGAECRVSNYACNCAVRNAGSRPSGRYETHPLLWLWWLLSALALAACCGGCIYTLCTRRRGSYTGDGDGVPVAYPVNAPPGTPTTVYGAAPTTANYGTTPPLYATPGYAAPVYGGGGYGGYGGGGMGAGTGAALGGAAGLLGGVLLGEAIADAGDRGGGYVNGGFGGDGGGGGGFDAGVGDFGGDF